MNAPIGAAGIDPDAIRMTFLASLVAISALAVLRILYVWSLPVDLPIEPDPLYKAAPFFALGAIGTLLRVDIRISSALNAYGLIALSSLATMMASSAIFYSGRHFPLVDADLNAIDLLLGFDWLAYMRFFEARPSIGAATLIGYASIYLQPLAIVAILAFFRNIERLYVFVLSMNFGLLCVCLIALLFPALGAYEHLGVTPADHPDLDLIHREKMTQPILWMRAASFETPFQTEVGLISFPSFHAVAAAINFWALWTIAGGRWVSLVLNGLMLAATPFHGSHYLIDVVAGLILAIVVIAVTSRCVSAVGSLSGRPAQPCPRPVA
jgi:PAP2 superfamily